MTKIGVVRQVGKKHVYKGSLSGHHAHPVPRGMKKALGERNANTAHWL